MLKKNFLFLRIFLILCIVGSFVLGFLFHQKKFFPYYHLQFFFKKIIVLNETKKDTKTTEINKKDQINLKNVFMLKNLMVSEKTYNTHTLPIKIEKYDLNQIEKKKFEKGGLCLMGERVLIFYNKSFFFSDNEKLHTIKANFLPENSIVTSLNCYNEKNNDIIFFLM